MDKNKFKNKYRVKSTRLSGWDYSSSGYYFITICTKNKNCSLGKIENSKITLSDMGKIVNDTWLEIPAHHPCASLDQYIIMPNHLHGIIVNSGRDGACPVSTLGNIIGSFKSACSNKIHKIDKSFQWQTRYYEHIIRNEESLNKIREYILNNPLKWELDEENPDNYLLTPQKSLKPARH